MLNPIRRWRLNKQAAAWEKTWERLIRTQLESDRLVGHMLQDIAVSLLDGHPVPKR